MSLRLPPPSHSFNLLHRWVAFAAFVTAGFAPLQAATDTFTTSGASTWEAPAGVTQVTVEVWGGGGRGGSRSTNGLGGGGAFARKVVTVPPGQTYDYFVGAGSTSASAGGDTYFINATTVMAKGGASVALDTAALEPAPLSLALYPGKTGGDLDKLGRHPGKVGSHLGDIPAHLGMVTAHFGKVGGYFGGLTSLFLRPAP